ncbi:MAG: glycine cleavage system aminomethyltransferase GcvT, partial [Rhodospirillaceae bacterium]|nr:glycine cleavage system aminomethyltransferase GcvT [Rhodospirillaceae bacterium]
MTKIDNNQELLKTPLDALHRELGAKMVPFAGYDMAVQYPMGVLKEHLHTRENAGLFDVSHMGQAFLKGNNAIEAFEALVPGDYQIMP